MGYTLSIGEAIIRWNEEHVRVDVETEKHEAMPKYGEPTDQSNERWPSYSAWADSCRDLGLYELVGSTKTAEIEYDGDYLAPLIQSHPGAAPITAGHVEFIRKKVEAYKTANPNATPMDDCVLRRGEWLLYWCDWAVRNCQKPVFVNS